LLRNAEISKRALISLRHQLCASTPNGCSGVQNSNERKPDPCILSGGKGFFAASCENSVQPVESTAARPFAEIVGLSPPEKSDVMERFKGFGSKGERLHAAAHWPDSQFTEVSEVEG
jgi:hypothetical protein